MPLWTLTSLSMRIRTLTYLSSQAVNALEGRVFNGNTIVARFYDPTKFEEGNYEETI